MSLRMFAAMPLFMLANRVEWTEENILYLRSAFVVAISSCYLVIVYLHNVILKQRENRGKEVIYVKPEAPPSLMPAAEPETVDLTKYQKTTYGDYEATALNKLRSQIMLGAAISLGIHYYVGTNPPLLLQVIMMPLNLVESPLIRIHLLNKTGKYWDELSEEEYKTKCTEAGITPDSSTESSGSVTNGKKAKRKSSDAEIENAINTVWSDGKKADYAPLLRVLLKSNKVNYQTTEDKYTALMVSCGNPESKAANDAVQKLISAGSDIMVADNDGWTALHWCCYHGNDTAAELLLGKAKRTNKLNKLVSLKDGDGKLPLDIVKAEADQLGERGARLIKLLEEADQ